MRVQGFTTLALLGCSVVAGHQHLEHEADREKQVPLHEQEYFQDSPEELERKWSFEVCCCFSFFFVVIFRSVVVLALLVGWVRGNQILEIRMGGREEVRFAGDVTNASVPLSF